MTSLRRNRKNALDFNQKIRIVDSAEEFMAIGELQQAIPKKFDFSFCKKKKGVKNSQKSIDLGKKKSKIIQTPLNSAFNGFNKSLERITLMEKFQRKYHGWYRWVLFLLFFVVF
jgi:hypothetical protein